MNEVVCFNCGGAGMEIHHCISCDKGEKFCECPEVRQDIWIINYCPECKARW